MDTEGNIDIPLFEEGKPDHRHCKWKHYGTFEGFPNCCLQHEVAQD